MRKLKGAWATGVFIASVALICFQLYTASFGILPDIQQRSIHLMFVLPLGFILKPVSKKAAKDKVPFYDIILAILAFLSTAYMALNFKKILWDPYLWISIWDKIFAVVVVLLALELSRRAVGWTFPIMAAFFFIYAFMGEVFPGIWRHQNFKYDYVMQMLYHTTNGIWGTMIGLSATMLAMFSIFGAMLSASGGSATFIKMGKKLTGKATGGAGKVALIASGLFGMISGSAMGNVVATGTFTIPMMKEAGCDNEWSGAICAVGSTGGQIMPPIMGAGAFIMAQLIGVPYGKIAVAAIFPAVLYYFSAWMSIHFYAVKNHIKGMDSSSEKINPAEAAMILVPLGVFLYFIIRSYTVQVGAFYATVAGLLCGIVVYLLQYRKEENGVKKAAIQTGTVTKKVVTSGTSGILEMAGLLGGAQIAISLISMTGFGIKLSDVIIGIGQEQILLCLFLSMIVCIILGMGLPTTAAYVLAASVLAPALITLGVNTLTAHFFVFYYATLATITPPVCAAVFLASGIAESKWVNTGILSVGLALPAFAVPFSFAYNEALLLQGAFGTILLAVVTALIGVLAISMAVSGFIKKPINWLFRAVLLAGGILLLMPDLKLSAIGLVVVVLGILPNVLSRKKAVA